MAKAGCIPAHLKYISLTSDSIAKSTNIRAYNIYGSLIIEIPNEGYQKISQINENLIVKKDNNLYYINIETQETSKIKSPEISIKDLQLTQEFLYIYDGNKVSKFKLTF